MTAPRASVPVLLGLVYFLATANPHHQAFLDDEARFLEALNTGRLAFFPGYAGFLSTARLLSHWVPPAAAFELIASLFGSASVAVFFLWMRRIGLSSVLATAAAFTFATGVYQLYNSSVGVTYTIEPFCYLATGYLCDLSLQDRSLRDKRSLYAAAAVLAFCGAFRQSTPLFLLPLFGYCCWRIRSFAPAILFAILSLAWLVPTLHSFGGLEGLFAAGQDQIHRAVLPSTLGRDPRLAAANLLRFSIYAIYGLHVFLLFGIRSLQRFELLWIAPGALFFALVYVAWPGYCLGVFAAFLVAAMKTLATLDHKRAWAVLTLAAILNLAQFFAARPIQAPASTAQAVISVYALQYSKAGLDAHYQRRLRDVLK